MKTNARLLLALLVGAAAPAGLRAADTLTALGRVVPRSGVVDVSGPAGDTVEQILVREGDWVEAGQPMARLSTAAAAARRVADAEAEVAAARTAHTRDLELARAPASLSPKPRRSSPRSASTASPPPAPATSSRPTKSRPASSSSARPR